jgi:hypothetical protein
MPRLSSTLRLAADPEDAMDEESGLRLGLVYSARARVLARHLGVLTFEAGVRAQKRTTIDGESWKRKARRREKTSRGGWIIPRATALRGEATCSGSLMTYLKLFKFLYL